LGTWQSEVSAPQVYDHLAILYDKFNVELVLDEFFVKFALDYRVRTVIISGPEKNSLRLEAVSFKPCFGRDAGAVFVASTHDNEIDVGPTFQKSLNQVNDVFKRLILITSMVIIGAAMISKSRKSSIHVNQNAMRESLVLNKERWSQVVIVHSQNDVLTYRMGTLQVSSNTFTIWYVGEVLDLEFSIPLLR
jgi:hypothetical protein